MPMFNGKINYEWPFSIAMLNYQRVSLGLIKHVFFSGIFRAWQSSQGKTWKRKSGFQQQISNSESVGFQSLGPGTGDMKMHTPKNRSSLGTLLEPFAGLQRWANVGM